MLPPINGFEKFSETAIMASGACTALKHAIPVLIMSSSMFRSKRTLLCQVHEMESHLTWKCSLIPYDK